MPYRCLWIVMTLAGGGAFAQPVVPPSPSAALAAQRYPQPVRVGDLIGRDVLQPTEAQPVLGHVASLARRPDGGIDMIVRFGGWLGVGARPIAVPIEAVALLGEHVAVMDLTPEQLRALPTADGAGRTPLAPDAIIRVGLTGPFH